MGGFLTAVGLWVVCASGVLGIFVATQTKEQKRRLEVLLRAMSLSAHRAGPFVVVHQPVRLVGQLLDLAFGVRLRSWRAFLRIAAISAALLICALAFYGVASKQLPAGIAPWRLYDENIDAAKKILAHPYKNDQSSIALSLPRAIVKYDGLPLRLAYCLWVPIGALATDALLNLCCVLVVRRLLHDLEEAHGFTLYLAALFFDALVACAAMGCALFVLLTVAFPLLGLSLFVLVLILGLIKFSAAFIVVQGTIVVLWDLSGATLRIAGLIAILPTLAVSFALTWSVISFPLKSHIHRSMTKLLLRASRSDGGALGIAVAVLGCAAGFLALVASFFQ